MCAWAEPAGPVSRAGYETLREVLLKELAAAGAVDFVLLVLHGAMIADGHPDCEGDLLAAVRRQVGPQMPIGALLDLHGNVSSQMIESGAVLVACKEYPHIDYLERAHELYSMLAAAAHGGAMPKTAMRRVPMLGLFGTTEEPVAGFVRRLKSSEKVAGILSVSAMHGFPWSDTVHTGASILVVRSGDDPTVEDRAAVLLDELSREFFELRLQVPNKRMQLPEALDAALALMATAKGPIVLGDGADNPGGGAACDSTHILQALIERGVEGVALGMIWDPQAALIASDAGVGARLALRIGGKVGPMSGQPVDAVVEVLAVRRDARQRGLDGKASDPLGLAVAVRAGGVDIVINSTRQQVFSPDCFTQLGIDLLAKRLVVVKSTQHFRAAFDRVAAATLYCDAPGTLNGDLARLPYQYLRRPMWPLDQFASVADDLRDKAAADC
jgi:microcystin degradation protein MlrC